MQLKSTSPSDGNSSISAHQKQLRPVTLARFKPVSLLLLLFLTLGFANIAKAQWGNALALIPGNRVSFSTSSSLNLVNNFSIEAWIYIDASCSDICPIVAKKVAANGQRGFAFYVNSWNTNDRRLVLESDGPYAYTRYAVIPNNKWTHVAVTVSSSNVPVMYVNGASVELQPGSTVNIAANSNDIMYIGCLSDPSYYNYRGKIDELSLWNKVLAPAEINSNKTSPLSGTEANLLAYYNFNEGNAGQSNLGITNLPDKKQGGTNNGTLLGFTLSGLTSNWVASDIASTCSNPTSGGGIAVSQTICYNTAPAAFTSTSLPSGHDGTLEYKWQSSTTSSSSGFSDIAANTATYTAGVLTTKTWYKRLARVNCMSNWTGAAESNVIAITIRPLFTAGTILTTGQTICHGGTPSVIGSSTTASGGDNSITYKWQANGVDIASSNAATYTPPAGLTSTTTYTRFAKDNTCNNSFTLSNGSWLVKVIKVPIPAITADGPITFCQEESVNLSVGNDPILDLSFSTISNGYASKEHWQSFVPAINGITTGIEIFLNNPADIGATISIYSGTGVGGALIYTASANIVGTNFQMISIPSSANVSLNAGSTYTFRIVTVGNLILTANDDSHYGSYYADGYGLNPTYNSKDYRLCFKTHVIPVFSAYQWKLNGNEISDATSSTYNAAAPGLHTVKVSDVNGCFNTSAGKTITINANPIALSLTGSTIFVNPGNNGTISSTTSVSGVSYQLYNASNATVQAAKAGNGSTLTWTAIAAGNGYYVIATNAATCAAVSNSVNVTATPNPTITTSGSLSAFTKCAGAASTAQSFTASGSNLIADITVTAPTGFEVSKTSSTTAFASSVTLTHSGATVANTTIWVRLTSSATGSPSGNVALASTEAETKNLAVSGTVIADFVPPTKTLADLDVTKATGSTLKYYNASSGGTELPSTTPITSASTTYYISQVVNGVESTDRLAVTAFVDQTPCAPSGDGAQSVSLGTVSSLVVSGTNIRWYDAEAGGALLETGTSLVVGTTYYASQTVGCTESETRLAVTITAAMP